MKFLFDYFPIICFFVAYKFYGIYTATAVTMGASVLQVSAFWLKNRRFENLHLIILGLVLVLGGATLLLHKQIFIQWKPSIVYWVFALILFASQIFGNRPLLQRMLGDKLKLPMPVWSRVNFAWAIFFLLLGFLNIYVVYNYTTDAWVNFKLFGTLGLTLLFVIVQAIYMARHMETANGTKE